MLFFREKLSGLLRPLKDRLVRATDFPCRSALLPVLLLGLVSGIVAAQQPDPSSSSPRTWRISGKVIDSRSGQALARCSVAIDALPPRTQSISLVTGEEGQFLFDGLTLGKYRLTATRRGYLTQSYEGHDDLATAIAVGPALKSEGLTFKLMPQSIVFGTVTDEAGEPIRRAQVRLFQDQDAMGIRLTQQRQMAMTDDRGTYEIANVSPDNYYLAVSAQPWFARGMAPMMMDDTQQELNAAFNVAYPTTFYPDATDSEEAIPIPVKGGERIEANMTLTAQRAVRLRIAVPRGEPSNYGVSIERSVFGQPEQVPTGPQTSKDGVVEIDGVLPGRYDVTLTRSAENSPPASTHFTADVAGNTTDLNQDGGEATGEITVSGKITSLESNAPSLGIALTSMHPRRSYFAAISKSGEFTFKVPPGEYEIVGQIPQMYLASIISPNTVVKGHTLQVKPGTSPTLEIVAGSGYGRIDGRAEVAGQPASAVMVILAPEDAQDNRILFRRDQSDSDGTFSLFDIVPGRYRLLAIADAWELEWANPTVLNAFLKKSIPIQIHAHDKLKETVEVQSRF
jgi:Carboxypeptidase regulatory-like domain